MRKRYYQGSLLSSDFSLGQVDMTVASTNPLAILGLMGLCEVFSVCVLLRAREAKRISYIY